MDVTLHIGAHRCATTTFQTYMRKNADKLAEDGTGFWGPWRTRKGLFRDIVPGPSQALGRNLQRRAYGRVQINLDRSTQRGVKRLIVSDENMLGSIRHNVRHLRLYGGAGEWTSRYGEAFKGYVTDVVLNVRSLDHYWASALGYAASRGRGIPDSATLELVAKTRRSWRDVIEDVACALPNARLKVLPFENFVGSPDRQLRAMTGQSAPQTHRDLWKNASPRLPELRELLPSDVSALLPTGDARWNPFTPAQAAHLRETYTDDLMWLTAGADGLAQLIQDPDKKPVGRTLPRTELQRGRPNDQDRRLAGAG